MPRGTRFGIRMDADGLLSAGEPGVQLTWMDARVGDRVITPRIGKPVEIQALWLNALRVASSSNRTGANRCERGQARSSTASGTNAGLPGGRRGRGSRAGTRDDAFRPNQILAVGGLPIALVDGARARRIVDDVERGF